jgi:hypothetical protein
VDLFPWVNNQGASNKAVVWWWRSGGYSHVAREAWSGLPGSVFTGTRTSRLISLEHRQ